MQRRIVLILAGYLVVVLLVGGWLALKPRQPHQEWQPGPPVNISAEVDPQLIAAVEKGLREIVQQANLFQPSPASEVRPSLLTSLLNKISRRISGDILVIETPQLSSTGMLPRSAPLEGGAGESELTAAQLGALQHKVSTADQLAILNILRQGLQASDLALLVKMGKDGLTSQEMDEVKGMLFQRLSNADLQRLVALYDKYK